MNGFINDQQQPQQNQFQAGLQNYFGGTQQPQQQQEPQQGTPTDRLIVLRIGCSKQVGQTNSGGGVNIDYFLEIPLQTGSMAEVEAAYAKVQADGHQLKKWYSKPRGQYNNGGGGFGGGGNQNNFGGWR